MAEIRTIQFKRGLKANLEAKLTSEALGVLLAGEPAFETDFGGLKIGDGIHDYLDLPYITGSGDDDRFFIKDPLAGQILIYDDTIEKWVNKDLTDDSSISYLVDHGLTIKGYEAAENRQMPVKDAENGLVWVTPVDKTALDVEVAKASASAIAANGYKDEAERAMNDALGAVIAANRAAERAEVAVEDIPAAIDRKIKFMTVDEYNALTEIEEDCFYFLKM